MNTTTGTKGQKRVRCAPCKSGKSPETTALSKGGEFCCYCGVRFEGRYLTIAQCTWQLAWGPRTAEVSR